jgi:hypothetical protein
MRIATMYAAHSRLAGWLIVLVIAAASAITGASAPAQAKPAAQQTRSFYCAGAAGIYKACYPPGTITTSRYGSVTIQVFNHAAAGEYCGLSTPVDENGNYRWLTKTDYVPPQRGIKLTFHYPRSNDVAFFPAGSKLVLRCKRASTTPGSDAGIGGYIYYQ